MTLELPLFPLSTVLFPGMPMPLRIFEDRYLRMMRDRQGADPVFGIVLIKSGQEADGHPDVHRVGTMASLRQRTRVGSALNITVLGTTRFDIDDMDWTQPYANAAVRPRDDILSAPEELDSVLHDVTMRFQSYVQGIAMITGRRFTEITADPDPAIASFDFASRLPLHTWERQRLLEMDVVGDRLLAVRHLVRRELALLYRAGAPGLAINHPGSLFTLN